MSLPDYLLDLPSGRIVLCCLCGLQADSEDLTRVNDEYYCRDCYNPRHSQIDSED